MPARLPLALAALALLHLCVFVEAMAMENNLRDIYFAGGCFWGVEKFFSGLPGVVETETGYANSRTPSPSYRQVCSGATNAAETVHVRYDPQKTDLETLTKQFFRIIDPLAVNRQGNDVGTQYRTGIYYADDGDREAILREFAAQEAKYGRKLAVELMPLSGFWRAEEEHQNYLGKHPGGYCHIDFARLAKEDENAMAKAGLRSKLTPEEWHVTQENGTEPPFSGKYWNNHEPGIYVDIVSGEPLFASSRKFDSGTGWPSFTEPVSKDAITVREDLSHGMRRVEVRSSKADSHLGHVFADAPDGGLRFCINSAALRFVPLAKMKEAGYGELVPLVTD